MLKESMGKKWILLCGDVIVTEGMTVDTTDGEPWIVQRGIGAPPHKPSSTGRIWVVHGEKGWVEEYFPSVFDCKWTEVG